jgi:hypothetical protein
MSRRQLDRRKNIILAGQIQEAMALISKEGLSPALATTLLVGATREVALRVFSGPEYKRGVKDRRKPSHTSMQFRPIASTYR